jgi:SAM-dependent methyltransferase
MQTYGSVFARIYNERWAGFAGHIAPLIRQYYERDGQRPRTLLDVCCGTGQLARHFLDAGYRVVGLDQSADMLDYARANTADCIAAGRADFFQGDAAAFSLDERFGLAVSTFDALNHLPDEAALCGCFQSVINVLTGGGIFIFDLNTRAGLLHHWNGIHIDDTPELTLINRAIYDGGERAYTRISGFVPARDGLYERFEEVFFNTMFALDRVHSALLAAGFKTVHSAETHDLAAPVENPEALLRVFFVAQT